MQSLELRVPPAILGAAAAALMSAVAWGVPSLRLEFPGRAVLSLAACLAGLLAVGAGVVEFRRARTTVNPMKPRSASALVVTGIYRRTRNPMYLGLALLVLAWGIHLANPLSLLVLPGFVLAMNRLQIVPEERAMSSLFGPEFDAYRGRVGRWL